MSLKNEVKEKIEFHLENQEEAQLTKENIEQRNLHILDHIVESGSDLSDSISSDDEEQKYDYIHKKKLSYNQVFKKVQRYYQNPPNNRYSSAFDILATYLKGQKIIYMESSNQTHNRLNYLMFPAIFLSSMCSVVTGGVHIDDFAEIPIILATINALIAFLLAIINYLKLDAASEAHKISSLQYDKLQSIAEFASGEILLFTDPLLQKEEREVRGVKKMNERSILENDLLQSISKKLKDVKEKVKEIKEANQFMIPVSIRRRYPLIFNTNVFSLIKKLDDYRAITVYDLKGVKNEIRYLTRLIRDAHEQNKDGSEGSEPTEKDQISSGPSRRRGQSTLQTLGNILRHDRGDQTLQFKDKKTLQNERLKRLKILERRKKQLVNVLISSRTAFSEIDRMFQKEIENSHIHNKTRFKFFCWKRRTKYENPVSSVPLMSKLITLGDSDYESGGNCEREHKRISDILRVFKNTNMDPELEKTIIEDLEYNEGNSNKV